MAIRASRGERASRSVRAKRRAGISRTARGAGSLTATKTVSIRRPERLRSLARRWVVERTFDWMTRWRRLVRDYEQRIDVSHAMILVAMGGISSAETLIREFQTDGVIGVSAEPADGAAAPVEM
ncbi:transposase [Mesorhizobium carmichaelinearum]|uniref:transposase n=1 Tax=Mesorhizobium carmichaelinearum TaxID=1208188 RepID=UPI003F6E219A